MLKKAIYGLIALSSAVAAYIYWGSQDTDSYDDKGFLSLPITVIAENNGFRHIKFINNREINKFELTSHNRFNQHINEGKWDEQWVSETLTQKQEALKAVYLASQANQFDLEQTYTDESPNFIGLVDLSKLLLLQAQKFLRDGNIDAALEYYSASLKYGYLLKTEAGSTLISYAIGQKIEQITLFRMSRLIIEEPLSIEQLKSILTLLKKISKNKHKDFSHTLHGEFIYTANQLEKPSKQTLATRWEQYKLYNYNQLTFLNENDSDTALASKLFDLLFALFPRFYLHTNTELSFFAGRLIKQKHKILAGCSKLVAKQESEQVPLSWLDLIRSNSAGLELRNETMHNTFSQQQLSHCFHQLHVQASKISVANKLFEKEYKKKLSQLTELSPYLDAVDLQDPFAKQAQLLGLENGFITSVGLNGASNPSEHGSLYQQSCAYQESCFNEPRFLLSDFDENLGIPPKI
ncbi:hypothetical protein [uncultured Pseudoteredinibacter sp.]|uniref:hypothetical protein n=1 Tax=uncultured Pseudoteredinibacter sp. TaxID=1641701 RepID=UPI00262D02C3|nr:hypothetical protein [uncultured Pseudoteredinibacter sp.]